MTGGVKGLIQTVGGISLVAKSFQMIGSSIGAAVERYDTLNRFPRVLQSMGFEASTTEASMAKLTAGIQGLPTRLDDIANTAKNLTVLTGNLELATDVSLALNNAFLASGASAADASRGMIQYTQQLGKGTVDMMSWRTLQETMGYALRETAEAMGFAGAAATTDLYKALQAGTVTFDQFNKKIIELNNATGGFAELAKTASAGIGTSFTNMQTAVVRGVTAIITALDKNRNIQIFIESIGSGFENLLKTLGSVTSIATTVLAPALYVLAHGMGAVLQVIAPLTAAFIAYRATLVITTIIQALSAGFTILESVMLAFPVVMNLVTAAQTALNVAMATNPVAVYAAAIAALVVGLIALYNWLTGSKKATDGLTDSTKKTTQVAESLYDAQQQNTQGFTDSTAAAKKFGDQTFKTYSDAAKALREYEKEQREARFRIEQDEQGHLKVVNIQNEKSYNARKAMFDTYLKDVAENQRRGYANFIMQNQDLYKTLVADWQGSPQIGVDYAKGIQQGLISEIPAIREAAQRVAAELEKATKAGLKQASPSKVGIAIGENFSNSVAMGLLDAIPEIQNASAEVANTVEEYSSPSKLSFINGLMRSRKAIQNAVTSISNIVKDNLDTFDNGIGFINDGGSGSEEIIVETTTNNDRNVGGGASTYNDYRTMTLNVNGIEELNALVDWWNNKRLNERATGIV